MKKNNRRDFIKKSAVLGLGFTIVPRHVLGRGFVAPSDKLNIGAIGSGGRGYDNIMACAKSRNVTIASLCDVDDRSSIKARGKFKKASYYKDYRQMLDTEKGLDAIIISTPDHMHGIQGMMAMEMGKHVYIEKPLSHDIDEARNMTRAAEKYKVVSQMGNQGASGDGVRLMQEWYKEGLIGKADEAWVWTNRPVWPQGIPWPQSSETPIPKELDWDLWLGTAPQRNYIGNLVPFNWRGWWDYGTGALGDMACHLIEPAYKTLQLGYPSAVEASVGAVYTGAFQRGYFPESCPPSSHIILDFPKRNSQPAVKLHWMDGGIQPERPESLGPDELMGDGGNGVMIKGEKGIMMCDTYGRNPRLLPKSLNEQAKMVKEQIPRVPEGHHIQWVNACMKGYKNANTSSNFEIAGPLTESVLMGNLALRSYDYRIKNSKDNWDYPGRHRKLLWDGNNMKVTNFEPANQYIGRTYRTGW